MPPRKSTKRKADAENLPVRAKDEASPAPKPAAQGTLQVFDSDDEGEEFAAATTLSAVEKPAVIKDSEEENETDDDEAPEAEGTAHVVSKVEMAAQSAKEAAQEKAAEEKRKRQQRDALLKQQASERKTKKAVQESTDQAGRRRKSRSLKTSSLLGQAPNSDSESDDEDELERQAVSNTLDEQFLDSDSEDGSPDPDAMDIDSFGETRPKQRKVSAIEQSLTRLDRAPRDERVGSTVYRVEKKRDDRLAPKVRKHARGTKGALLARGRAPVKSKGGFFKK